MNVISHLKSVHRLIEALMNGAILFYDITKMSLVLVVNNIIA